MTWIVLTNHKLADIYEAEPKERKERKAMLMWKRALESRSVIIVVAVDAPHHGDSRPETTVLIPIIVELENYKDFQHFISSIFISHNE